MKNLRGWADTLNKDKFIKVKNMIMLAMMEEGHGCDWTIYVKQECNATRVYKPHKLGVCAERIYSSGVDGLGYDTMLFDLDLKAYTVKEVYNKTLFVLRRGLYIEGKRHEKS